MVNARRLALGAVGVVLVTHALAAQGLSQYRNFALGSDLASVSTLAGVASSEAKTTHKRPAVLQDLEWRPSRWMPGSTLASTDPVERIVFSFYNDKLFRVVVDYGRDRTEGMTEADMIDAVSASYGTPLLKTTRPAARVGSRIETESGSPVARWGETGHTVVLYRSSSYRESYRLIVTEVPLNDLARQAETQATRLDDQEAPSREIARQKKERDDGRVAAEKARLANKGVFRP